MFTVTAVITIAVIVGTLQAELATGRSTKGWSSLHHQSLTLANPPLPNPADALSPVVPAIAWRLDPLGLPGPNLIHSGSDAIAFLTHLSGTGMVSRSNPFDQDIVALLPRRDGGLILAIAAGNQCRLAFADGLGNVADATWSKDTTARDRWIEEHAVEIAPAWERSHDDALIWLRRAYRTGSKGRHIRLLRDPIAVRAERVKEGWAVTGTVRQSDQSSSGWRVVLADDGSAMQISPHWIACGGSGPGPEAPMPTGIN